MLEHFGTDSKVKYLLVWNDGQARIHLAGKVDVNQYLRWREWDRFEVEVVEGKEIAKRLAEGKPDNGNKEEWTIDKAGKELLGKILEYRREE